MRNCIYVFIYCEVKSFKDKICCKKSVISSFTCIKDKYCHHKLSHCNESFYETNALAYFARTAKKSCMRLSPGFSPSQVNQMTLPTMAASSALLDFSKA